MNSVAQALSVLLSLNPPIQAFVEEILQPLMKRIFSESSGINTGSVCASMLRELAELAKQLGLEISWKFFFFMITQTHLFFLSENIFQQALNIFKI